jgi:hypothetical protein
MEHPLLSADQVRDNLTLIGLVNERLETVLTQVAEVRFQYEVLRRAPEFGVSQRPGAPNATADDSLTRLQELSRHIDVISDVFMSLTGTPTIDEARSVYLEVLSTFQHWGTLREQHVKRQAGLSVDEDADAARSTATELLEKIATAKGRLLEAARKLAVEPPPSPSGLIALH